MGGIYLLGLPSACLDPTVLEQLLLGAFTSAEQSELELLASRATHQGIPCCVLEPNFDIDVYEDLRSVAAILRAQRHSAAPLAQNTLNLIDSQLELAPRSLANNRQLARN